MPVQDIESILANMIQVGRTMSFTGAMRPGSIAWTDAWKISYAYLTSQVHSVEQARGDDAVKWQSIELKIDV